MPTAEDGGCPIPKAGAWIIKLSAAGLLMSHGQKESMMARYPNIGDHGLIGDLQTAALVTTDGTVDWFCCPRFDSPSVCASLLDADRGGYFPCRARPRGLRQ